MPDNVLYSLDTVKGLKYIIPNDKGVRGVELGPPNSVRRLKAA